MAKEEEKQNSSSSSSSSNANGNSTENQTSFPSFSDSDTESDSDSEYSSYDDEPPPQPDDQDFQNVFRFRKKNTTLTQSENTAEANIRDFSDVLDSKLVKSIHDEEDRYLVEDYNPFDFPKDDEEWTEEDLGELWADGPLQIGGTGWDPAFVEPDEWDYVKRELARGRKPPIAPFYLPYRKHYPAIPDNHFDISNPKATIEELDRIEEFLKWVSYVFADGSSYEGTVWDDYAHGRGVFASQDNLVRYEGEWFQNQMEGHGVVEVDIPDIEPMPGSKLEAKMRAEGRIIARDFMSPEDREWLEKDIEDAFMLADGDYEIPFYENEEWVKHFGRKPEKGRYRYAGQWKHGRMHGCGLYEVNDRMIYGRFYFGNIVEPDEDEDDECNGDVSAMHAGIAEVAAAKARMFINKPDGMVREERGPYNDPQHPYFYEAEDVWMAPGFINQFFEVPDRWKTYVEEVDQEREMWLNSFYKAPLRLPLPAELEYWWSKDENREQPEFVVINKEPEPDPEDPSNLIYTEDPVILHTPSGLIINYVPDEEHGIRLFWQPPLEKGEEVDPEKAVFLPLGYDEFFGRATVEKEDGILMRVFLAIESVCKPLLDKLVKKAEELKEKSEMMKKENELDLKLMEAEWDLAEAMDDLDQYLEREEEEEAMKAEMGLTEDDDTISETKEDKEVPTEDEEEEEEDEEDEDDVAQSGFGSVKQKQTPDQQKVKPGKERTTDLQKGKPGRERTTDLQKGKPGREQTRDQQKGKPEKSPLSTSSMEEDEEDEEVDEEDEEDYDGDDVAQSSFGSVEQEQKTDQQKGKPGKSPFSTSSLAFASCSLISAVPSKLLQSFSFWKKGGSNAEVIPPVCNDRFSNAKAFHSVSFRPVIGQKCCLKAVGQTQAKVKARSYSSRKFLQVHSLSQTRSGFAASANSKSNLKAPRVSGNGWLHAAPEIDLDILLSLHSTLYFEEHRETV